MRDRLRVARGLERITAPFKLNPQFAVIVNFAILKDHDTSAPTTQGLLATL
jgi:hypothetical protein